MENEKRLIEYISREDVCNLCDNKKQYCGKEKCPVYKAPTVDAVELPPIKIDDTAYFIIHGKIYKAEVYFIRWEHHRKYGIHSEISANVGQYSSVGASFNDFGKTVFLTEEDAKAALAKMDGERKEP